MSKTLRLSGLLIVLTFSILLSACGGGEAEPTINPDLIYTSAAMTVAVQLTEAAAANPTSTFTAVPPTETQALPTLPVNPPAITTGTPGQPLVTSTTLALPTFTSSPLPPVAQAKYEVVDQSPADGTKVSPGTRFDMVWIVKNTGTETWTEKYSVQFFTGDRIGGGHYTVTKYEFGKTVKPGETIKVRVDMQAPKEEGEYYSWWKLKDANGNNFGDVDVTIIVSDNVKTTSVP